MNEQSQRHIMKAVGLWKGQGFPYKPGQPLTECVEPALNVIGFTTAFFNRLVTVRSEDVLVGVPEITERMTPDIWGWYSSPEFKTTGLAAVTDEIGNYLPGTAT